MNNQPIPSSHSVDPDRLSSGEWSHQHNRTIGEGDIAASYSADMIALHSRVRKPFRFQNGLWVCVGQCNLPVPTARAYRLIDTAHFNGDLTTYTAKTRDSEAARNDSNGFYHGMAVTHGGHSYVLAGPSIELIAGEQEQMALFGA